MEKKVIVLNKTDCCGCSACFEVCPKEAIRLESDQCGFQYPIIDENKCVNCGLCAKACVFKDEQKVISLKNFVRYGVYAAKNKDKQLRLSSRSGGVFFELVKKTFLNNGVVYGAQLDSDFVVRHHRAIDAVQASAFRKSKYVQSDMGNSINAIKEDLKLGREVLFSGTPCQCAAVKTCVDEKDREKLLLVDIVCHGVPSPLMFKKYIEWIEKNNGKIIEYEFRAKNQKVGWDEGFEKIRFGKKEVYQDYFIGDLFYNAENVRPSCHVCPYASINRVGDITLGDFWGIDSVLPEINDNKGISLLLINSEKGDKILKQIKNNLKLYSVKEEAVLQPALQEPCGFTERYNQLWEDFIAMDFDVFIKKYGNNSYNSNNIINKKIKRIVYKIKAIIKKGIRYATKRK